MAAYDPVRESSQPFSPPVMATRHSVSSARDSDPTESAEDAPDDSIPARRPSRSASLIDLLNPSNRGPAERERPSSSASSGTQASYWGDQRQQPQSSWTSVETSARGKGSPRFRYDAGQDQVSQPLADGRHEKSPSLHLSAMLNPSPALVPSLYEPDRRPSSRSGLSQLSRERAGGNSPTSDLRRNGHLRSRESSIEAGQGQYLQADRPSLRVNSRTSSYGSASGSPLTSSRFTGSPLETSPVGLYPAHQGMQPCYSYTTADSPRSKSFIPLPSASASSPQSSQAQLPNGFQSQSNRSADGFRIPWLPLHRSPEPRRTPLPPALPSPSTSHSGSYDGYGQSRDTHAQPMTPLMTSGSPDMYSSGSLATASMGPEYFGSRTSFALPMTPGGRSVMSPVTPGVPMTPGSQMVVERARTSGTTNPTTVTTHAGSDSRGPATLSESNMKAFDQAEGPLRPTSSSRMSVDGLLATTPSSDAQQAPKCLSHPERHSTSDSSVFSHRDPGSRKRPRVTIQDPEAQKRLRPDTALTEADEATEYGFESGENANDDGSADTETIPTTTGDIKIASEKPISFASPPSHAVGNGQSPQQDTNVISTKTVSTAQEAPTASSKSGSQVEESGTAPSTASSVSSTTGTTGKVKLLDMEEMDRLSSRDSKKRKSLGTSEISEPTKSIKSDRPLPSSLPPKPSLVNGSAVHHSSIPAPAPEDRSTDTPKSNGNLHPSEDGPLPYRPNHRVSAPDSIRRPLSQQDLISLHETIEARGANTLRRKWVENEKSCGRGGNDGFEQVMKTWGQKYGGSGTRDYKTLTSMPASSLQESEVARHYNSRQELGLQARNFSPILPLKNFNNWVKSVLIGSFGRRGGKVMDMGGGKGGDLQKWDKLGIRELVLADIAATSVDQAKARYTERRFRWKASFFTIDCFGEPLATSMAPEILAPPFDTVSLQFCMHYGWSTLQRSRLVIENVSRYLDKGGVFIGTIPNSEELYRRRDSLGPDELAFGNEKYRVRFEQKEKRKPFGDRYTFFLDDAVDELPEYVVEWDQFESLARECGLSLIFKKPMADVWEEFRHHHEFENLARRMKVSPNPRGSVQPMDDDLWEATTIYLAFAFEKIR